MEYVNFPYTEKIGCHKKIHEENKKCLIINIPTEKGQDADWSIKIHYATRFWYEEVKSCYLLSVLPVFPVVTVL